MSIFFDEKGNIKTTLLCEDADKVAKALVVINQYGKVDRSSITSAQLRRFYGDFKGLEKKFQFKQNGLEPKSGLDKENAFLSVLPLIKMVKSKVAYAANPSNQKIPRAFMEWMNKNIDAINTSNDFEAFMLHFEAVVGFCYGHGVSNKS